MVNRLIQNRKGFTVIEVLTAVAIVAIMVAILIPSVAQVRKFARKVSQKAQMNGLSIGLEMFKNDFNRYPDSSRLDKDDDKYNGAQKLSEAMFGQDLLGVHPAVAAKFDYEGENNVYRKDGTLESDQYLYTSDDSLDNPLWQNYEDNIACRKGPYVEPEKANATDLRDIYKAIANLPLNDGTDPLATHKTMYVVTDVYKKKNTHYHDSMIDRYKAMGSKEIPPRKVGMPVLYFKANTSNSRLIDQPNYTVGDPDYIRKSIYSWDDNRDITDIIPDHMWDDAIVATPDNYLGDGTDDDIDFFNMVMSSKTSVNPGGANPRYMPYNSKSFILVSAGEDGFYGTADDVFNFDKEQ